MEECSVCLEPFGLDDHIPKSLDCRHAVCTECVMDPTRRPLQICPICRRDVINHSDLPNDLSIIAYLEKKKREKYLNERKEKIKNVVEQALKASEDVDELLKADNASAAETVEEMSAVFNSYMKHLLNKCQQRCKSDDFLSEAATQNRNELENTLQELQTSVAACTSLLDNPHVTKDQMDRCESEALNAVDKARDSRGSEAAMWNSYRQLVLETFAEISTEPPSSDHSFTKGNAKESDESMALLTGPDTPHIPTTPVTARACPNPTQPGSRPELVPGSPKPSRHLPEENKSMRETARYRIQCGERLEGLCYYNERLYTVEGRDGSYRLCMYQVTGEGLTLLDTVRVENGWYPRADGHSQQVYIPRGDSNGVSVVSWDGPKLTRQRTLRCVGECQSVGVMSPHRLYACDLSSGSVSVVRVTDDTVRDKLRKHWKLRDKKPSITAVLGNRILVIYQLYGHSKLVVYENGLSNHGTLVSWPAGLQSVCGISSDGVSRFLVCDGVSKAVFILDMRGKLCDKIYIDTDSVVWDCTAEDGKLWVGCHNGDIVVMSPK